MSEITSLTKDASFRYANALFNLALETNSAHKFEKDLESEMESWQKGQQVKDMQNKIMSAMFGG